MQKEEFNYLTHLRQLKNEIAQRFIEQLNTIDGDEIYFHDDINEITDGYIPYDNMELITIIEESGNESEVEECLLTLDRGLQDGVLRPMAYECLRIAIFEDDFFQYLQEKLNNETIDSKQAKILINHIKHYLEDHSNEKFEYEEVCEDCGSNIDFASESETYDYNDDEYGNTNYTCQACLEKVREQVIDES